jgi:uncharacterized protein YlxP (DUF503 family)
LKDKRRSVKSFKDRVRNRHNASSAEVESLDSPQRAVLAVAVVGNDRRHLEGVLNAVVTLAGMDREMVLTDTTMEWL